MRLSFHSVSGALCCARTFVLSHAMFTHWTAELEIIERDHVRIAARVFQGNLARKKNNFLIDKAIHCVRFSGMLNFFFPYSHFMFHSISPINARSSSVGKKNANWIYLKRKRGRIKRINTNWQRKNCVCRAEKRRDTRKRKSESKTQKKKNEKYGAYMSMNNILKRLILFSCDNGKHTEYTEQQSNRHRE